jgi:hypothetical protein
MNRLEESSQDLLSCSVQCKARTKLLTRVKLRVSPIVTLREGFEKIAFRAEVVVFGHLPGSALNPKQVFLTLSLRKTMCLSATVGHPGGKTSICCGKFGGFVHTFAVGAAGLAVGGAGFRGAVPNELRAIAGFLGEILRHWLEGVNLGVVLYKRCGDH